MKQTTLYFSILLAMSIFLSGCAQTRMHADNGRIAPFSAIESDAVANIYYTQSPDTRVRIMGNSSETDIVSMNVENGVLYLKRQNDNENQKVDIYISSPQIERLVLTGVGNFSFENAVEGKMLEIRNDGVTNVVANHLMLTHLIVESNGVGNITLGGKTNSLQITSSGVGNVHAHNLDANTVITTSLGVGNVYCYATEAVDLTANGKGNIFYGGNPSIKNINEQGTGHIQINN